MESPIFDTRLVGKDSLKVVWMLKFPTQSPTRSLDDRLGIGAETLRTSWCVLLQECGQNIIAILLVGAENPVLYQEKGPIAETFAFEFGPRSSS